MQRLREMTYVKVFGEKVLERESEKSLVWIRIIELKLPEGRNQVW